MNFNLVCECCLILSTRLSTICPKNKLGDPEDVSHFHFISLTRITGLPLVLIHAHFQRNSMMCYWPISVCLQACGAG